jgi:hypothetical protein
MIARAADSRIVGEPIAHSARRIGERVAIDDMQPRLVGRGRVEAGRRGPLHEHRRSRDGENQRRGERGAHDAATTTPRTALSAGDNPEHAPAASHTRKRKRTWLRDRSVLWKTRS